MTTPDDAAAIARRHERHVETPRGRVYVTEIPGGDSPIVLMHGFPDDHRIYDKLLPRLSPRRAVAFDFVGYGRSDRKDGTHFSPEDHGAEITAVLDALGTDRARPGRARRLRPGRRRLLDRQPATSSPPRPAQHRVRQSALAEAARDDSAVRLPAADNPRR